MKITHLRQILIIFGCAVSLFVGVLFVLGEFVFNGAQAEKRNTALYLETPDHCTTPVWHPYRQYTHEIVNELLSDIRNFEEANTIIYGSSSAYDAFATQKLLLDSNTSRDVLLVTPSGINSDFSVQLNKYVLENISPTKMQKHYVFAYTPVMFLEFADTRAQVYYDFMDLEAPGIRFEQSDTENWFMKEVAWRETDEYLRRWLSRVTHSLSVLLVPEPYFQTMRCADPDNESLQTSYNLIFDDLELPNAVSDRFITHLTELASEHTTSRITLILLPMPSDFVELAVSKEYLNIMTSICDAYQQIDCINTQDSLSEPNAFVNPLHYTFGGSTMILSELENHGFLLRNSND